MAINKKLISLFGLLAIFAFAYPVKAADYGLENINPACLVSGNCTLCDAVKVLVNISDMIIAFSGLAAMVMIIWGGIFMLTAFGKDDRITAGKKAIVAAIFGLSIVFVSWTIVNTIIIATLGTNSGGFSKVVSAVGGGADWSKCPSGADIPYGDSKASAK